MTLDSTRIGKLMTPTPRTGGPHTRAGQRGTCLAVCPDGTNGLVCVNGVIVLLMETGVVAVDSADNWCLWTERTADVPKQSPRPRPKFDRRRN